MLRSSIYLAVGAITSGGVLALVAPPSLAALVVLACLVLAVSYIIRRELYEQSQHLERIANSVATQRRLVRKVQRDLKSTRAVVGKLSPMVRQGVGTVDQALSEIKATRHEVAGAAERTTRSLSRVSDLSFRQLEASLSLRSTVRPRRPMPYSRGWAASPDLLLTVVETILDEAPELVVECGSGLSTLWIGYALEVLGTGRCVSLEHEASYGRTTREEVAAHGLGQYVEVRHAPLRTVQIQAEEYQWYDPSAIADLEKIDALLIDGPPASTGEWARYPAGPLLFPRMRVGGLALLDDTVRLSERLCSDRWLKDFVGASRLELPHEKGCHAIRLHEPGVGPSIS